MSAIDRKKNIKLKDWIQLLKKSLNLLKTSFYKDLHLAYLQKSTLSWNRATAAILQKHTIATISLKIYVSKHIFSTIAAIVAIGTIIWQPGFEKIKTFRMQQLIILSFLL